MEIFYVGACFGLTILIGVGVFVALVIRRDRRQNAVWAGQWAERFEQEQQAELANAWPSELSAELSAGGAR